MRPWLSPTDSAISKTDWAPCSLPLRNKSISDRRRQLPSIQSFGRTGCVKVTPAHDPNDYEWRCAITARCPVVIGWSGWHDTPEVRPGEDLMAWIGMEARAAVVEQLPPSRNCSLKVGRLVSHNGRLQPTQPRANESYLSEQWFLKYPSVEASTRAV